MRGELLALDGEVLAEVDAAALLPCEAAGGDLADERVRGVEQVPESLGTIEAGKRSEPLAISQLILLYHMFQARNGG